MNKAIINICMCVLFPCALFAQSIDSLIIKKLKHVSRYNYAICNENQNNCLGYGSDPISPGPQGQICNLIIQNDSAILIDSYFRKLIKINLKNGDIIRESNPFQEEGIGSLIEIIHFNEHILLLSQASGNIYCIDNFLNIENVIKIPMRGYLFDFFYSKEQLYILSGKTVSRSQEYLEKIAFKINPNNSIVKDTLIIDKTKCLHDTLLYGKKIQMMDKNGYCYLITDSIYFEIPEIIPQLNYYDKAVGYNSKYLVYFIRNESFYEMIVCEYEELKSVN